MEEKKSLIDKCKKDKVLPGFAISRMPIPVFESFMSDVHECYAGVYWAKLNDLMRKAEAYDMFVQLGMIPAQKEELDIKDEKEDTKESVMTFKGKQTN